MRSLFENVKKLRENLLEANDQNYKNKEWITDDEIHVIRKGVEKLEDKIDLKSFAFVKTCFCFESIYRHFHFSPHSKIDDYYDVYEEIYSTFSPLLIYLKDNDYEINIKKIRPSDKISLIHEDLTESLEKLEEAYHLSDFRSVTTLSSSILQSLFKQICEVENIDYSDKGKFPDLYNNIKAKLKLDAKEYEDGNLIKFCSKINTITISLNEIRNLYSDSHGLSQKDIFNFKNLPNHHFKLIVDSTKTLVNFFVETYEYQFKSLSI